MPSRRDKIQMTPEEVSAFLDAQQTIVLTSIGADGYPHPMPMWFLREDDGAIRMTTFRKSQKVRNLERNPRVSLLAEDGTEYSKLRGVVIHSEAELVPDTDLALDTMFRIAGGDPVTAAPAALEGMRRQAEKRVVIRCRPGRVISWDHGKLGGAY
ncbi:MAG: pyridoxamine 5'-phosphate oxidase family protein [Myxococcota bacterium]|nr:pyridoxamine 5'-phosphate oxidase family protein [Myxococcota bacterium]